MLMTKAAVRDIRLTTKPSKRGGRLDQKKLLRRIADGELFAIAQLMEIHGLMIWNLAVRFRPSTVAAEGAFIDIVMDVMKKAKRHDPTICSQTTFIQQVAHRRLMNLESNNSPDRVSISR